MVGIILLGAIPTYSALWGEGMWEVGSWQWGALTIFCFMTGVACLLWRDISKVLPKLMRWRPLQAIDRFVSEDFSENWKQDLVKELKFEARWGLYSIFLLGIPLVVLVLMLLYLLKQAITYLQS